MSGGDEDDKPTVVLDLNALKKQRQKEEEALANIAVELEFAVHNEPIPEPSKRPVMKRPPKKLESHTVIFFDFESDFFEKSLAEFPTHHNYHVAKTLPELTTHLRSKSFQIVVFNYDVNPKAVNQLSAQIRNKFPTSKVLIMAKNISPEKAKIHAATASGADGYYQFPLETAKIESEFQRIYSMIKKAG